MFTSTWHRSGGPPPSYHHHAALQASTCSVVTASPVRRLPRLPPADACSPAACSSACSPSKPFRYYRRSVFIFIYFKTPTVSSKVGSLYGDLFKEYRSLHPRLSAEEAQKSFNTVWLDLKTKCNNRKDLITTAAVQLLQDYRESRSKLKSSLLLNFFSKKVSYIFQQICDCDPKAIGSLKKPRAEEQNDRLRTGMG